MTDAAVFVCIAIAVSWFASAALGAAAGSSLLFRGLTRAMGGARAALVFPPLLGLAGAGYTYACHRNVLYALLDAPFVVDAEGCVHESLHATSASFRIVVFILVAIVFIIFIRAWVQSLRSSVMLRRIVGSIDRSRTRRVRAMLRSEKRRFCESLLYIAEAEDEGPFAATLRRRNVIFLPGSALEHSEDMRVIVSHEQSHFDRYHLWRRWFCEIVLAALVPGIFMNAYYGAARDEEEFQADDDAAASAGSARTVARALLRAAERVGRGCIYSPAHAGMVSGNLTLRILRLMEAGRARPGRFVLCFAKSMLAAVLLCCGAARIPSAGIWIFCSFENLIGLHCC